MSICCSLLMTSLYLLHAGHGPITCVVVSLLSHSDNKINQKNREIAPLFRKGNDRDCLGQNGDLSCAFLKCYEKRKTVKSSSSLS